MHKRKLFFYIFIITFCLVAAIIVALYDYKCNLNCNKNNKANLVFITDDKYKKYTQVAILSAILNKNENSIYDISILCVDLNKKDMEEYKKLVKHNKYKNNNLIINTIPVTLESIKDVGNYKVSNYVSRADLFKFFLPDILKDKDKVLYIDGDTIIRNDLLELYNTNLRNRYLGAVKTYVPIHTWHKIINNWYYRTVNYNYNCGVMLMNLKKMREDGVTNKLIASKQNDKARILMSQTAFNEVIPLKSIIKLSPVYNFRICGINDKKTCNTESFNKYNFKKIYFPHLIKINSYDELKNKAVIIHFHSEDKLWYYLNIPFANKWWEYAHIIDKNWVVETQPYELMYPNVNIKNSKIIKNMPNKIQGNGKMKDHIFDASTKTYYQIFFFLFFPNLAQLYKKL